MSEEPGQASQEIDYLASLPRTRTLTRSDRFWRPFWVLPLMIVVTATLAGVALPRLDHATADDLPLLFHGGASGARSMLSTIAGAMISVTGLVFSITMVVIQLASSQFTPRVLGDFLANRITQTTLGIFTASFTYALTVLRSVREGGQGGDGFVPQISVTVGFLLVLASVGMFLAFIHHTTSQIQVGSIVSRVGESTLEVVTRYFPDTDAATAVRADEPSWQPPTAEPGSTVEVRHHGHVVEVDHARLVEWAHEHACVVEVVPQVGQFVVGGQPAVRLWGCDPLDDHDRRSLFSAVVVEQDRVDNQDPGLGIRKLVDIAERALSPGLNDPTTAIQVLDELHLVARTMVQRADLPRVISQDGTVRLVHRPQEVGALLTLMFEEVLHYGSESLQVPRRVIEMVEDLRTVARPEHVTHLETWQRVARTHLQRVEHDEPT